MAKKNLGNLLGGFISEPANAMPEETATPGAITAVPTAKPEESTAEVIESVTDSGILEKDEAKEARTTLVAPTALFRKIKYIAMMEETTIKGTVARALRNYILNYEKRHGKINV